MAMKGIIKKLLLVGLVALVVVIIGVVVLVGNIDKLARAGIIKAMETVLLVEVELESVKIELAEGRVVLKGLKIGNPEGYKADEFLSVGHIEVIADIKSFRTDEPLIQLIAVKEPSITFEYQGKGSNVNQLLENASRFSSGDDGDAEEDEAVPEGGAGKKVKIEKLLLENARVAINSPIIPGGEVSLTLPKVELNNIGGKSDGASPAEIMSLLIKKIMQQVAATGGGILPEQLTGGLAKGIGTIKDNGGSAVEKIGEGIGNIGKSIGGFFGGKKTEEEAAE